VLLTSAAATISARRSSTSLPIPGQRGLERLKVYEDNRAPLGREWIMIATLARSFEVAPVFA